MIGAYFVKIILVRQRNGKKQNVIFCVIRIINEAYVLNYLGYSWLERKENLSEALELILIAAQQKPHDVYY